MKTRKIIRKQLNTLPCRFILGCIGHTTQFSPEINSKFLQSIENNVGPIEEILPVMDFPNPPKNYVKEMGNQPVSTTMVILQEKGVYTDIHHMKKDTVKLESQFTTLSNGRIFNINPGAVGTYGLILSSHKSTGGRQDIATYAYGNLPQFFFGGDSYYERVSRWTGNNLELIDYIKQENKFPEYYQSDRIEKFKGLVRTLKKNKVPIELL